MLLPEWSVGHFYHSSFMTGFAETQPSSIKNFNVESYPIPLRESRKKRSFHAILCYWDTWKKWIFQETLKDNYSPKPYGTKHVTFFWDPYQQNGWVRTKGCLKRVSSSPPWHWPCWNAPFARWASRPGGSSGVQIWHIQPLSERLHPRKLIWIPKMMVWKRWTPFEIWPCLLSMFDFCGVPRERITYPTKREKDGVIFKPLGGGYVIVPWMVDLKIHSNFI